MRSDDVSRPWHLPNVRMAFLTRALRRRLGPDVVVRQVQYRLRGWNSPQLDPVHDAQRTLAELRTHYGPKPVVLVGHSMGGRVAARLASKGGVDAVVALAPWWVNGAGDHIPAPTRLLVVHGTADTRTDPADSQLQVSRARARGLDAQWIGIEGVGHHMVRRWREWHRHTVDFVAESLTVAR
ncbi:hypothetical protein MBOU_31890 [Mycobacterium bourgelatii]|uniref:AB hydrolase-1 domain-containing protein n=1 Tax=Mycobacterium bourgelatii TaxID=1273442 RepID=A0A7I9YRG5_MYCBU|nr:hypothetical protein MBOU_31890 [Mycobacterium bourgelatii]